MDTELNNQKSDIPLSKQMRRDLIESWVIVAITMAIGFFISYAMFTTTSDAGIFILLYFGIGIVCDVIAGLRISKIYSICNNNWPDWNKIIRFLVSFGIVIAICAFNIYAPYLIKNMLESRHNTKQIEEYNNSEY